jgi:flagellar biosynthesis protein FlhF
MQIRRFEAANMQEALKQVKEALGPEALILSTRSIRDPRQPRRSLLEIVAAMDQEPLPEKRPPAGSGRRLSRHPGPFQAGPVWDNGRIQEALLASGLAPDWVAPLLRELQAQAARAPQGPANRVQDHLFQKFSEGVAVIQPGAQGKRAFALVGPTGVGKTTTIAKLAAHFSLKEAKKVTLITVDTYRIGAVEQLRTYGRLLGLPLRVARQPEELRPWVEDLEEDELVLIDTAGSSPQNREMLQELRDFLTVSPVIGSHLVVSATTKESDLGRIIDRFGCLPLESYVCTKLDETEALIPLFNQLVPQGRPLSYLTSGQRVPEDLEPATKTRIAQLIIDQIHWN